MDPGLIAEIGTANEQLVSRAGNGFIRVQLPKVVMTRREALIHAAWIVAYADDDDEFGEILSAVCPA